MAKTNKKIPVAIINAEWHKARCCELLPKAMNWMEHSLDDPDTPDSVKLGICKEVREGAVGKPMQSVDLTNSDGSLSPLDITITFGAGDDSKA